MAAKDVPHKLHRFPYRKEWEGKRLKEVLKTALPALGSRSSLLVVTNGLVSMENGAAITNADAAVPQGSTLLIDLRHGVHGPGKPRHPRLHERLKVVYDDEHVVVVAKRAGTLVQPVVGQTSDAAKGPPLVELLKHYWRAKGVPVVNPVVVQRLDVETSGLLVLAKTVQAGRDLQYQLKPPRKIRRTYQAITAAVFQANKGEWKTHLGRGALGLRQSLAEGENPRTTRKDLQYAHTRFRVRERFAKATLLDLQLETGRTHQIRIHCAEAGHPILADELYRQVAERMLDRLAKQKFRPRGPENPAHEAVQLLRVTGQMEVVAPSRLPARLALHANSLSFIHPQTRKRLNFEEPLPEDLERYLERLRAQAR